MDFEPILRRAQAANPNGYVVIEHLPQNLIGLAKRNLTEKILELGIPIG
jgi:sugar phosphate isomerase/epimerase